VQEVDKRIGLLRLLLADLHAKQARLSEMEDQYRAQLARIVDFVVYREGDAASALSLMAEVQTKLDEVVMSAGHVNLIVEKAQVELDVLSLTKSVAEARSQLAELERRQQELSERLQPMSAGFDASEPTHEGAAVDEIRRIRDEVEAVSGEISRLNNLISEASEQAARTIQAQPHASR
jgi:chromosome segregation ATPase